MIIREPKPEEYGAIADLVNTVFNRPDDQKYRDTPEMFGEEFTREGIHLLVAIEDDIIVGTVRYEFPKREPGTVWLFKLAVLPEYRNKGIGAQLTTRVEEIGKELGYKKVSLSADEEDDLPRYYKQLGYHVVEVVKRRSGRRDARMSKELK
jgi:ribosomal protein S18 acetylase RimI-like enzyme